MSALGRVAIAVVVLAGLAAPPSAGAQGLDQSCQLALTRLESTTANVLLVDTSAVYWLVSYVAVPGTRLRIEGEFPHARYMSFNVYDPGGRPIDSLPDVELAPEEGSANPFAAGADRTSARRSYTAFVEFGPPRGEPAPNTLYAADPATGQPSPAGTLWYRIYVPDEGRGWRGGVPLPRVTLEPAGAAASDAPSPPCRETDLPTAEPVHEGVAEAPDPLPVLTSYPGRNPPRWTLFTNLSEGIGTIVLDNERGEDHRERWPRNEGAGFYSNRDISYVFAPASRGFGPLLVIRGRAPTFADTRAGTPAMPGGTQLRYFSFCQYDPLTQRVVDCRPDDRVAVGADGSYTVVVGHAAQRPANARAECGVTFLRWGPQKQGLLIYRHLLASPDFRESIAQVAEPGQERATLGAYYPEAEYVASAAAFEQRGCPAAASAQAGEQPAEAPAAPDGSDPAAPREDTGGDGAGRDGERDGVRGVADRDTAAAGGDRSLARTGLDVGALLALGLAATALGLALRRRAAAR